MGKAECSYMLASDQRFVWKGPPVERYWEIVQTCVEVAVANSCDRIILSDLEGLVH